MIRSRKKVPITGITLCDSEKQDKRAANHKLRAAVRSAIAHDKAGESAREALRK